MTMMSVSAPELDAMEAFDGCLDKKGFGKQAAGRRTVSFESWLHATQVVMGLKTSWYPTPSMT